MRIFLFYKIEKFSVRRKFNIKSSYFKNIMD